MSFAEITAKPSREERRAKFFESRKPASSVNRDELLANANDDDEPRVLTAEEIQASASDSLDNTLRMAQETVGVGANTLLKLDQQTIQMHENAETLRDVNGELNKADKTLKRMEKGLLGWFFSSFGRKNKKAADEAPEMDMSLPVDFARDMLIRFYNQYNPDKLVGNHIEDTLKKYRGQEKKIFALLNKKYPESELFSLDFVSPAPQSPEDQDPDRVLSNAGEFGAAAGDDSRLGGASARTGLELDLDELSMDPAVLELKRTNAQLAEEQAQEAKLAQIGSLVGTLKEQSRQTGVILSHQLEVLGQLEDGINSTTDRVKTATTRVVKLS